MKDRTTVKETLLQEISRQSEVGTVLTLSGPWGSGKTHLWREIEAELTGRQPTPLVVYASLFGVDGIAGIKSVLVNETILSPKIEKYATIGAEQLKRVSGLFARILPGVLKVLDNQIGSDLISKNVDLTRYVPSSTIVCLDDLERCSETTRIEDVLGLVNYLSEQRHCRVVLILNEEHLTERYPQYQTLVKAYRERVVKTSIRITADVEAIFDHLASRNSTRLNAVTKAQIIAHMARAKCNNLRTLSRIIERVGAIGAALKVDPAPEQVTLVCALTMEDAAGGLESEDFYAFIPGLLAYKLREKMGSAEDPKRMEFYSRHYSTSGTNYKFSLAIYGYIANGLLDRVALVEEINQGAREPRDDAERLTLMVTGQLFNLFSDVQHREFVSLVHRLLGSTDRLSATELRIIVDAAIYGAIWARFDLPADFIELAEQRIVGAAREGDTTLDDAILLVAKSDQIRRLLQRYFTERTAVAVSQRQQQLLTLIWSHEFDTISALLNNAYFIEAACSLAVLAELHATKRTHRQFYFRVLHLLANWLRGSSTNGKETLQQYVALMYASGEMENSDEHIFAEFTELLGMPNA